MFGIALLLYAVIGILAIILQVKLFKKDFNSVASRNFGTKKGSMPFRYKIPIVFLFLSMVGLIFHLGNALVDPMNAYSWGDFFSNSGKLILLSMVFFGKAAFAHIFTGLAMISVLYFLFTYSRFDWINIAELTFDWFFSNTPGWVETTYTLIVCATCVGSSMQDGIESIA